MSANKPIKLPPKGEAESQPQVGSSDLLCVFGDELPIMAKLESGWYLVAHPNGPAIARKENWEYLGHLGTFPGDENKEVPPMIKWRAVNALMNWAQSQPTYPTHNAAISHIRDEKSKP